MKYLNIILYHGIIILFKQMKNKELNLCEVLKGHEGETFYSPAFGNVTLCFIDIITCSAVPFLAVKSPSTKEEIILSNGKLSENGEVMLFPCKDQRDWDKWIEEHKNITYEEVCDKLFSKGCYYIKGNGTIDYEIIPTLDSRHNLTNCTSERQAKKLLAINQFINVQKYIEKDWQPNWDGTHKNWHIFDGQDKLEVGYSSVSIYSTIWFSSEANAHRAIKILGEDTIKLALSTDW